MLKIAFNEYYAHPLPQKHRFPMLKYELLPEQLCYEGTATTENFFSPEPVSEALILKVHEATYWHKLSTLGLSPKEERRTGFPLSARLVHRERVILGGTVANTVYALQYGVSMNIAGGTHHAFTNRGEGFCLLNDIAVGAQYLIDEHEFERILIVDLDVHQGNGTAEIFRQQPSVFTFSMHGANNYPLQKEQSDLDIALPDGTDDAHYLKLLTYHLPKLMQDFEPQFVFFQSGVDVLATDKLGRLGLSIEGCRHRDKFVLETCKQHSVPVAINMGGGYSERIADIVEAHANTFRTAQDLFF